MVPRVGYAPGTPSALALPQAEAALGSTGGDPRGETQPASWWQRWESSGRNGCELGDRGLVPPQLLSLNSHSFPLLPLGLPSGNGSCHIQRQLPSYISLASFAFVASLHCPASLGLWQLVHWREPNGYGV